MSQTQIETAAELDARGLLCPMPVVKTAKAMKELAPGEVLKLIATDRGSIADIPAWASTTGNELLEHYEEDGAFVFFLRKSGEV
ncbi:MAG TPA: sulfurtransferase TusA family protein [Gaiellaceae bacterium]|nr:sulfurtransferase TusA family protein [Gaiellaceae bacterium]